VVAPESAAASLAALRTVAPQAAMIGELDVGSSAVVLNTSFGGQRSLDELEDDPLPRIC
jgi:hydrogenase expression/formation protein HypE